MTMAETERRPGKTPLLKQTEVEEEEEAEGSPNSDVSDLTITAGEFLKWNSLMTNLLLLHASSKTYYVNCTRSEKLENVQNVLSLIELTMWTLLLSDILNLYGSQVHLIPV